MSLQWGLTKSAGGGDFSRMIDAHTGGGGYSHAFLWDPTLRIVYEAHIDFGVRPRDRVPDPAREELHDFPNLTPDRELAMRRAMTLMLGNDYDTAGAIHLYCGWVKEDKKKQFCSEYLVLVGQAGWYFPGASACETAPNKVPSLTIE